jgi:hypothetical protein
MKNHINVLIFIQQDVNSPQFRGLRVQKLPREFQATDLCSVGTKEQRTQQPLLLLDLSQNKNWTEQEESMVTLLLLLSLPGGKSIENVGKEKHGQHIRTNLS